MLKVITFNAAILDVRFFGRSLHRPVAYVDARLDALALALRQTDADLVFLQELFHPDKQARLCGQLAECYPHVSGLAARGWQRRLGNELLIFSRYPLGEGRLLRFRHAPAEELRHTSKGFYHVCSDLPGLGPVNLVNFHMSAGGKHDHPQSATMESIREKQVQQMTEYLSGRKNVLLAGDLNAGLEVSTQNYRQLTRAGFQDLFVATGASGISWDPRNPLVAMGRESDLPPQRIDHVFTDAALSQRLRLHQAGIVFSDACVSTLDGPVPLSDHYGLAVEMEAHTVLNLADCPETGSGVD